MFSYYEFTHPMNDRLTDEKWRDMLKTNPKDLPEWLDSFVDLTHSTKPTLSMDFEARTGIEPAGKQLATWGEIKQIVLYQNYPNPFNPETWIPYRLASASTVVIYIYNINGQLIRILRLGYQEAGLYITRDKAAHWDGRDEAGERVASGVYFYAVHEDGANVRKMVILR
jgi:hypothetical protein